MKTIEQSLAYISAFTEVYKNCSANDIALREVKCMEVMLPYIFLPPEQGDLYAGRLYHPEVGLSPEPLGGRGVCFNYDRHAFDRLEQLLAGEDLRRLQESRAFWETENTRRKIREAFPTDISKALPYDDEYYLKSHVAFPLYRTVGIFIDYDKLLALGISGMHALVVKRQELAAAQGDLKAIALTSGMLGALELFTQLCNRYADMALKQGMSELSETVKAVAWQPPVTFWQAAQLSFLYTLVCGSLNYGRMDVYLGDFYAADLAAGRLDPQRGLELVQSLFRLIDARKTVFHGRVVVGGMGRRNEQNADQFALVAIEASRTVLEPEPQFTLRFYEGQAPLIMERAMEAIGEGRTYPILYNDDVNVPAVAKAFCVSDEDAQQYLPLGCGEYVLDHRSFGSPNGIINLLKALEVTLHNGFDPVSNQPMGLSLGELDDFVTYDDFFTAYQKQLAYYIEILARQEFIEYEVVRNQAPFLFMSMLYDDCIERGRAIFDGGIRYLGGTVETYGNVNTANSLAAIKRVVFEKKLVSPQHLLEVLDKDFEGYEEIHQLLLRQPKYGNDDDYADQVAVELHDMVCTLALNQRENVPLHSYLVVIINNEANTLVGEFTGASADGRRARSYLANANAPTGGTDYNGITALLNSTVKLRTDFHAGAVQNLKLSRGLFTNHSHVVNDLLRAYFRQGGSQLMITVLDQGELERALKNPQQYRNLMVRVGGFSARFVELSSHVQREIMSRTLY